MCFPSQPDQQSVTPPTTTKVDEAANVAANTEAERRRRRLALSRAMTRSGGAMQGAEAGTKTKLGE